MIPEVFAKLHERLALHGGECVLCLATTANVNNPPILVGSMRLADNILAGNLILRKIDSLPEIIKRFDGLVSRFFIDCEVKAGIDLGAVALELIPANRRHFFKPNDFTVEAADEWVAQRMPNLEGARVVIVGAGNIGAKLALRLAERGSEVRLVGRKITILEAMVEGLNAIRRGSGVVVACSSIAEACAGADVVVGCTPGTAAIDTRAVESSQASLLLDIGNGCFTRGAIAAAQERGLSLEVLSPTAGWEGYLRRYVATRKLQQGLGRRQLGSGVWIVSRGIMGASGDVLVDDISQPAKVLGVCNGMGDLLYGEGAMQRIKSVEESLGIV
jgi:hypothetical protein